MASAADRAFHAALDLLSRRDYFVAELAVRLQRKGFEGPEVEAAVQRCGQAGYLDDEALARRFAELRGPSQGWGPHRLAAEMRARGVADPVAAEASRLPPEIMAEALRTALRRVESRARTGWWRVGERRARMVSSLVRRGFDSDRAYRAVAELAAERESQHDALDDQSGDQISLP